MPEYINLHFLPTSPPAGTLSVHSSELMTGDQIFGARTPGSHEWNYWLGRIITTIHTPTDDEVVFSYRSCDGEMTSYAIGYSKRLEFLILRPEAANGDDRYPHRCTRCGGKAYINLFDHVDCQKNCQ